ncbi:MAG: redoxin domain-containing protein [Planctomycetes bacterium]|nr:redoxin domain-containing protein [Planctomycetota bacterium]
MPVIAVGAPAPEFTLKNQEDKEWSLAAQRGKAVVLLWYPLDWSPTCEKENCAISTDKTLYGPNRVVVGISRDSMWSHREFKKARNIGHDLLADPMLEVTRKYGLEHPKVGFISQRATVIVDPAGTVAFVQVQEKTPEARDLKAVQDALAKLG